MDANGLANQHAWLVAESERSWALSMTSVSSVAMNTLARSFEVLLQVCRLDPVTVISLSKANRKRNPPKQRSFRHHEPLFSAHGTKREILSFRES